MNGYVETKQKFCRQKNDDIIKILEREFIGENPPVNAWWKLIQDVKQSERFRDLPDNVIVALEYPCPANGMSIDLLIAFEDKEKRKRAFVIEAKDWSDDYIASLDFGDDRRHEKQLHPQIQASRQALSFSGYTDIGERYSVTPFVYVKCSPKGINQIKDNNPDSTAAYVKVTNSLDDIFDEIVSTASHYCGEFTKLEIYSELRNAKYQPSRSIIRAMEDSVSGKQAFVMTPEQTEAFDSVFRHIKNGKKIIRITGAAGSGKTAILIHLFVKLIKQESDEYRPILVTGPHNTDYYRSLFPQNGNNIFAFSKALDEILNVQDNRRYVVLMDEAQHNDEGEIEKIVRRQNVTLAVCYDETQAIRALNCIDELKKLESDPNFADVKLYDSMRYNGSKIAERNVRNYLDNKPLAKDELFDFRVCTDFENFQCSLISLIEDNPKSTVAVVGLLCKDTDDYTFKRKPLSKLFTKWYDKAERDWMKYVTEKNYLDKNNGRIWVGTWWMEGLDVDYAVVIAGDDIALTDEGITVDYHKSALYQTMISVAKDLHLPENLKHNKPKQYAQNIIDYIDSTTDTQLKAEFETSFAKYVKNYYYIMLTRGRKGGIAYFHDNRRSNVKTTQ